MLFVVTMAVRLPAAAGLVVKVTVSDVAVAGKAKSLAAVLINMAKVLDVQVVAEGVERVEEWQVLAELGCDAAQGWLIAPAVSANELPSIVQRWHSSKV